MNLSKNKYVIILLIFAISFLLGLILYFNRIMVYEDLRVEICIEDSCKQNVDIVLITPFNRKIVLNNNNEYRWNIKDTYFNRLYLKFEKNNFVNFKIRINNHIVPVCLNRNDLTKNKDLIEVSYVTSKSFFEKVLYIVKVNVIQLNKVKCKIIILLEILVLGLLILLLLKNRINTKNVFLKYVDNKLTRFDKLFKNKSNLLITIFCFLWLLLISVKLCV